MKTLADTTGSTLVHITKAGLVDYLSRSPPVPSPYM